MLSLWVKESAQSGQTESVLAGSLRTKNSSFLIIYWTTVLGRKVRITGMERQYTWQFFSLAENCSAKCELSTNISLIGEASATVIHARDTKEMPNEYHEIPWILQVNENPRFKKSLHKKAIMKQFCYSVTYRLDSDFPCTQFLKPKLTKPVPFAQKAGLVIAIYSHRGNVRTVYMHRLNETYPDGFIRGVFRKQSNNTSRQNRANYARHNGCI